MIALYNKRVTDLSSLFSCVNHPYQAKLWEPMTIRHGVYEKKFLSEEMRCCDALHFIGSYAHSQTRSLRSRIQVDQDQLASGPMPPVHWYSSCVPIHVSRGGGVLHQHALTIGGLLAIGNVVFPYHPTSPIQKRYQ